MKKIYLFIAILLISGGFAQSQIIDSFHPTLDYVGPENVNIAAHAEIMNNGPNTLDVLCERFSQTVTTNHYTYFCWIVCYDTSTLVSPSPITLAPGASTNSFEGWVAPSGVPGYDEVTYRYYDMNGMSDTLYLNFTYDFVPTGIRKVTVSKYSMNITGANPANTFTKISYVTPGHKDARIVISNLLGSKVSETRLHEKANSVLLPVSNMKSGVYVCSLLVDGTVVVSKKLIVSHD